MPDLVSNGSILTEPLEEARSDIESLDAALEKLNLNKDYPPADMVEDERPDTIPESVKSFFFSDIKMPDLVRDYDIIGFDADHSLIKYKLRPTQELLIESVLNDLVNAFDYPAEIQDFDFNKQLDMHLNNAVWDIENGTVLKLGEKRVVMHAMKGWTSLTQDEIKEIYGDPPISQLKWPETTRYMTEEKGAHWTLMGYHESYLVPIICHVQSLDIGKKPLQFAFNLYQAHCR